MMQTVKKQQGMTAISMLLLLIVAGFLGMLVLKLGPIYMENFKVKTVLSNLESQSDLTSLTTRNLRGAIHKRLYVNEVRRLEDKAIKIKRLVNGYRIDVDYEVRENILANVDAVVSFQEQAEIRSR